MTTDNTAQTVTYERNMPIADFQVVSIIPPGALAPAQVGVVLTVSGLDAPLVLRINTRRALDQLVEALMRHGDSVFGVKKM